MKKRFFTIALILLFALPPLLCACGQKNLPGGPEELLAFPGTRWDMTPQELIQALDLEEGTYEAKETPYGASAQDAEGYGYYVIEVKDTEAFDLPADVSFGFLDHTGDGRYWLNQLVVLCADGTDYRALVAALTQYYGEPVEEGAEAFESILFDTSSDTNGHLHLWRTEVSTDTLRDRLAGRHVDVSAPPSGSPLTSILTSDGTLDTLSFPLSIYKGTVGARFTSQYGLVCGDAGIR